MALCKNCGEPFQWGHDGDKWVLLQPLENDEGMDMVFMDEHGCLRADHRDRCMGKSVNVTRLMRRIPNESVKEELSNPGWIEKLVGKQR